MLRSFRTAVSSTLRVNVGKAGVLAWIKRERGDTTHM
jgi:hypothetical protein